VREQALQRAALYVSDELFFTGTAAEVTPIRSVDKIQIGEGRRGDITARIQQVFFEITSGEREAPGAWLTYVNEAQTGAAANDARREESAADAVATETEAKVSESFAAVGTE
jgi:hypothetical protein